MNWFSSHFTLTVWIVTFRFSFNLKGRWFRFQWFVTLALAVTTATDAAAVIVITTAAAIAFVTTTAVFIRWFCRRYHYKKNKKKRIQLVRDTKWRVSMCTQLKSQAKANANTHSFYWFDCKSTKHRLLCHFLVLPTHSHQNLSI